MLATNSDWLCLIFSLNEKSVIAQKIIKSKENIEITSKFIFRPKDVQYIPHTQSHLVVIHGSFFLQKINSRNREKRKDVTSKYQLLPR